MTYDIMSTRTIKKTISIGSPDDIFRFLRRYGGCKQEQFLVLTVNGSYEVIRVHIATLGLVNKTVVHPREVFIRAITDSAFAIVVVHNHPSGKLEPSAEDVEITKGLKEAGELLGIRLIDHLIISRKGYYSFKLEGKVL